MEEGCHSGLSKLDALAALIFNFWHPDLATRKGTTKAEIIKRALATYNYLASEANLDPERKVSITNTVSSDNVETFIARMGGVEAYESFAETFKKDMVQAEKCWSGAAAQGDAVASFNLGAMYANGDHNQGKNLVLSYLWLRVSLALGHYKAGAALEAVKSEMTPGQLSEVETLIQADHVQEELSPAVVKALVVLKAFGSSDIGPPSLIH